MGRYARKKQHKGDKPMNAKYKTKRRIKDHDQIHFDLKPEQAKRLLNQPVDYDQTGNAQFYCIYCARYFISGEALKSHCSTKPHKQRMRALTTEPYTQDEADRAGGLGNYKKPKAVDISIPEDAKTISIPEVAKTQEMDIRSELSGLAANLSAL